MRISLCMIVRDEEGVLERCLKSADRLFDEIVIADTGSTDGTKQIAEKYGNVFDFSWKNDFAAARNFIFSKGTGEYLCWLDADDVISSEARALFPAILELLEREKPDIVFCPYRSGGTTFFRERFIKNRAGFSWQGRVHECIPPRGKIVRSPFFVTHLSSEKPRGRRNLDIYEQWAKEEELSSRDLFYFGRELYYHGEYGRAIKILEGAEQNGWYVNRIEASKIKAKCLLALGKRAEAIEVLLQSLSVAEPRAGTLCELGNAYMGSKNYKLAAFWYRAALLSEDHSDEGDFDEPSLRGTVPLLQLVVCCWNLGDKESAKEFHLRAKQLAPEHPSVLYNERFFKGA